MTTIQQDSTSVAAFLRKHYDKAHQRALIDPEVCDGVFVLQDMAVDFAAHFTALDPAFDRDQFLVAALDGVPAFLRHDPPALS